MSGERLTPVEISREEEWSYDLFKEVLVESCRKLPPSAERFPDRIDIGKFGDKADEVVRQTMEDPETKERSVLVKLDLDGKLQIQNEPTIGTPATEEGSYSVVNHASKYVRTYHTQDGDAVPEYSQYEYRVVEIHSHPFPATASYQDFWPLVCDQNRGTIAEIVVSQGGRDMYMRTLDTPEIEQDKKEEWFSLWGQIAEIEASRIFHESKTPLTDESLTALVNESISRKMCETYHLVDYSAESGNVLSRVL